VPSHFAAHVAILYGNYMAAGEGIVNQNSHSAELTEE
jgi:hypothetical protein